MKKGTLFQILLVLATLGVVDAGYLTYEHFANTLPTCSGSIFVDCGKVLKSPYSVIFGIPLTLLGLIDYLTLFFYLAFLKYKRIKLVSKLLILQSFAGFLFSFYLVYLQIGVIGSICLYCMISALISTLIYYFVQKYFENDRKEITISSTSYFYKNILRPFLFLIDSEQIHNLLTLFGKISGNSDIIKKKVAYLYDFQSPKLFKKFAGIPFRNSFGLAAGFDYDANLTQFLPSLGFGFATVGTVTNLPYEGNPPPRLGRLPKSRSLMVNKGFKSSGAQKIADKLKTMNFEIPIGISIGRSNSPTLKTQSESVADIVSAFKIFEKAKVTNSYYELNISCPNLIHSQQISFYPSKNLDGLLKAVDKLKLKKPLFVKMPIEKSDTETLSMLKVIAKHSPVGVIFGNLQKDRNNPSFDKNEINSFKNKLGYFSGKPTFKRSNELIKLTRKNFMSRFVIIGCGGVFSADDAKEKVSSGADLIQLITGLIYEGPQLVSEMNIKFSDP